MWFNPPQSHSSATNFNVTLNRLSLEDSIVDQFNFYSQAPKGRNILARRHRPSHANEFDN
jgi:hypothetical protein